jgi:ATP-dependent RNA helicase RhlE
LNSDSFNGFGLSEAILRAIRDSGYRQPTEVQRKAIPEILAGNDVMAAAQTGTGKTAAFCLPMLQLLDCGKPSGPRALVLTPTRELALQVEANLRAYGRYLRLKTAVILGGVPIGGQIRAMRGRPDILVATPGRLLDLVGQHQVRLDAVEILVLDEADRMLDMGFIHDVRRIVSGIPKTRQTLLFSATLSSAVGGLASDMLRNPVSVRTVPAVSVAAKVDHKILFVDREDKLPLLVDVLKGVGKALVFTSTKHRADRLTRQLGRHGISAGAIHSNKSQNQRQRSLAAFDQSRIAVLVATDIVARGIDVDRISHVINYELPKDAENYVHRVGRTARAEATGIAVSFCDASELPLLREIEKLLRQELPAAETHAFHSATTASMRHQGTPSTPSRRRAGASTTRGPRRHGFSHAARGTRGIA